VTPAHCGEVDDLLEPVRSWPERTTLRVVSEGMPRQPSLPTPDSEPWCVNTDNPHTVQLVDSARSRSAHDNLTTCTNALTQPHSFRNADRHLAREPDEAARLGARMFSSGVGPYSTRFLRRVFWLYVVFIVGFCVSVGVGKLDTPILISFVFFGGLIWLGGHKPRPRTGSDARERTPKADDPPDHNIDE
jgi:hypothetical protein